MWLGGRQQGLGKLKGAREVGRSTGDPVSTGLVVSPDHVVSRRFLRCWELDCDSGKGTVAELRRSRFV